MRYLKLYLHFLRFSFSKAMEFRLDFFFRIFMDVAFYAVSLGFFEILYRHTSMLGGWNEAQIFVFVGAFLLADALHMTIFANNLWWLPIFINRGDLDYYLVRPVSTLFFLSLREFAANSFMNVLIAGGVIVWALARYPGPLSVGRLVGFFGFLLLGVYLHFLSRLLFILPVFWMHSARGLLEISWSADQLGERPVQIYRGWLRLALLTVLPLAFLATIPAETLFEGPRRSHLLLATAVTLALTAATLGLWRRGLAAYVSASS